MKQYYTILESPFCDITLVANSEGLTDSHLETGKGKRSFTIDPSWIRDDNFLSESRKQVSEYFQEKRHSFDIPLSLNGTDFQLRVWKALQDIPFGEVRSYTDVAKAIGSPKAARAVGLANSKNPIPLIIPCHRVIGANGNLTGFAHGLEIKSQLLNFEAKIAKK